MRRYFYIMLWLIPVFCINAQEIQVTKTACLDQIYGLEVESESLLPMNDLNIDLGYVLYQADVEIQSEDALLEVENVRDFAAVYVNGEFQGVLRDDQKKLTLAIQPGNYAIQLYVENIGRITYGPEVLDNSKGLFGNCFLDGQTIQNWKITELKIRDCEVESLSFAKKSLHGPGFYNGCFEIESPHVIYLDISGWGMGEAWVNGYYIGSYWEAEKQRTIQIPVSVLKKGNNEVVIFDLKNNEQKILRLSNKPVFD